VCNDYGTYDRVDVSGVMLLTWIAVMPGKGTGVGLQSKQTEGLTYNSSVHFDCTSFTRWRAIKPRSGFTSHVHRANRALTLRCR
jgi:hypothetical protein